jgi:hypothetical protein
MPLARGSVTTLAERQVQVVAIAVRPSHVVRQTQVERPDPVWFDRPDRLDLSDQPCFMGLGFCSAVLRFF